MLTQRASAVIRRVAAPLGGVALLLLAGGALAQTTTPKVSSDEPAGYLVYPKVVVDTAGEFTGGVGIDTVIQLTNTGDEPVGVNCWYVNANGHCSNDITQVCRETNECPTGGRCEPGWVANDFTMVLTPLQPVSWRASEPTNFLPCDALNPAPSVPCPVIISGSIPQVTEDPFEGELKCVQTGVDVVDTYPDPCGGVGEPVCTDVYGGDDQPVQANDLKGEATIYAVSAGPVPAAQADAALYNAIGIQAVVTIGTPVPGDATLVLGEEYAGCPAVLIVGHLFDDATSPINPANVVRTELTVVPCSEDLTGGPAAQVSTAAQMLIYNEFEQRFSTSRHIECYENVTLSDIDTRPGPGDDQYSVFNVGTQGTLAGQTRIRGVAGQETDVGHGLLAVAQEIHTDQASGQTGSAAINVNYFGERNQNDFVELSVP